MNELLRVEDINFRYNEKIVALKNISAVFNAGERVAVLGGNGAGKSTFFLCCNGVLRPQTGKIFFGGKEITKSKKDIYSLRQAVGLVFQDPDSQFVAGSVESEVSFGPMNLRLPDDEVARRVDESLAQMNIGGYRDYAPHYLSGGEKKRVSIADILAMRPGMILFDEPTASLDPLTADMLEDILNGLSGAGITIVVSTHDVNFAYRIADRAIVFAKGEIIADAGVDEVFASDTVLAAAGLKKPLLYEAYEYLYADRPQTPNRKKPKTIEEFKSYTNDLRLID
jgi:cobalt/nickel transport system ATP-binding protein